MKLRPQSINKLASQFFDTDANSYDNNTTLTISTSIYNAGDYKAGRPAVGTFPWVYQAVGAGQALQGLFTCHLPSTAIGPGPNANGCVFPITLVTIGIASDLVTTRFTHVVQAFPLVEES